MAAQTGLSVTLSKTPRTGFLVTKLILYCSPNVFSDLSAVLFLLLPAEDSHLCVWHSLEAIFSFFSCSFLGGARLPQQLDQEHNGAMS